MSFFKKMLSSLGVGSAKVDLILEHDEYCPGDTIDAIVKINGGKTEQKIQGLNFSILSNYTEIAEPEDYDDDDEYIQCTAILDQFTIEEDFIVYPDEEKEIPIYFTLPLYTPLTYGDTNVWIQTGLDIEKGKDASDTDYIKVLPGEIMEEIFISLQDLGFEMVESECEAIPENLFDQPFIQEFEFKPYDGPFKGKFDEVELFCIPNENRVVVYLEIDRKARSLGTLVQEMLNNDEVRIHFEITEEDLESLKDKFYEILMNVCDERSL